MKLEFKNRIAFFNTLAAAASTFLVFVAVYLVVYLTAYRHVASDISKEKAEVFKNIEVKSNLVSVRHSPEWDEKEHKQVEVNPTFLQITDKNGDVVFHSANLKDARLEIETPTVKPFFFDAEFNNERIRQGQFTILNAAGQDVGLLSVGVSQAEAVLVLRNLGLTLSIAFPLLTLIFYWVSSFAAARGIAPIHQLIKSANSIDHQNIGTRLPLPPYRDEIHTLATTINELLSRIESSLKREKQITADISHELRTPLTGIRGTLEVLLRKRREPEQYEQKLEFVLQETDRLNSLLEQLLQLSRLEAGNIQVVATPIDLHSFLLLFLEKWQPLLAEKGASVDLDVPPQTIVAADAGLLEAIAGNLLSNALKYGPSGIKIGILWDKTNDTLIFKDDGPGISPEQLPHIFDRFYRTDSSRNANIQGTGLGLSIVKKLADLQGIALRVQSVEGAGTAFFLGFLG